MKVYIFSYCYNNNNKLNNQIFLLYNIVEVNQYLDKFRQQANQLIGSNIDDFNYPIDENYTYNGGDVKLSGETLDSELHPPKGGCFLLHR